MAENSNPDDGVAPLHLASEKGHVECVNVLIEYDANINIQNVSKATPLHWAARKGQTAVVEKLIDHGAYVNMKDVNGNTPLSLAIAGNHKATAIKLLELGADLNAIKSDQAIASSLANLNLDSKPYEVPSLKQLCKCVIRAHYRYKKTAQMPNLPQDLKEFLKVVSITVDN